jgi:membrane associated rhomboid family serine protease
VLILPLHQPLTRASFPRVTAGLVLVNLFVFVFLQSGDPQARHEAWTWYQESGLAAIEAPLFERHLADAGDPMGEELAALPAEQRSLWLAYRMQQDRGFRARLADGELFDDSDDFERWQPPAATYRTLRERIFTERFAFNAEHPRAAQLFGSMFLHGGIDHLLGNMLFLIALGLLVEGPLGAGLFAGLYLATGAAAGLAWLGWHGDGPGSVIGASGAIAGLMGAFCVLWGRRRVRFFYWFFVVFDYVRAPALVLLPLWLGWELLQMWLSDGSRVAYSAHAGGIAAGAVLALLVKQAGWQREGWFERHDDEADPDRLYAEARQLLGRLQLAEAEPLLAQALARAPQRFDLRLAHYRCARYANNAAAMEQRLAALLALPASLDELDELVALLQDLPPAAGRALPAEPLAGLALRLASTGRGEPAVLLLEQLQQRGALDDLPQRWLQLAFRLRDSSQHDAMRQALQRLVTLHPDSPQAVKARFLLEAEVVAR